LDPYILVLFCRAVPAGRLYSVGWIDQAGHLVNRCFRPGEARVDVLFGGTVSVRVTCTVSVRVTCTVSVRLFQRQQPPACGIGQDSMRRARDERLLDILSLVVVIGYRYGKA
jgi:hypothetical protein